jgi:steroid 5-alpha reductase family enzyme
MSGIATAWLATLPAMAALALVAWAVGSARSNVGLVDIAWSLFFAAAVATLAATAVDWHERALLVAALVALWSLRLAAYLAWRNWNAPEDHRYRAIREHNQPGFVWKSLVLVFGLQALLAWLIAAPLVVAMRGGVDEPLGWVDTTGATLAMFGIAFEAVADAQLARFKADPRNAGRVLDSGLWRYTRHPNYFGEFCVWWGFYLVALAAGGAWTVFSPLLMSVLLLRVSGVALLEKDIGERRPAYREYVARTNAFFPGPSRPR